MRSTTPADAGAPRIIGHRGAPAILPENTLPGFAAALADGAGGLECDVHLTADGEVVVAHDPDLHPDLTRDATGAWLAAPGPRICRTRYDVLARFDMGAARPGSATALRFPRQGRCDGAHLPRLRDVLDLCAGAEADPLLVIEVKSSITDPELAKAARACMRAVCARLRAHPRAHSVRVQSFDWHVLAVAAATAPGLARSYATRANPPDDMRATFHPASPWIDGPVAAPPSGMVAARGGRAWAPHVADLDPAGVAAARAVGLEVLTWTVTAPDAVRAAAALGVDAIITDDPETAARALATPP